MPCPRCGSNELWDDDLWWGCKRCDFMSNSIYNKVSTYDVFNRGTSEEWKGSGPPYPVSAAPAPPREPDDDELQ